MAAGRLNDRTPIVLNWGPGWIFYLPGENERLDLNSDLHGLEPSVGGNQERWRLIVILSFSPSRVVRNVAGIRTRAPYSRARGIWSTGPALRLAGGFDRLYGWQVLGFHFRTSRPSPYPKARKTPGLP